jgi:succinate dehydrogenase hydrophobic anchor subunit
MNLIEFFRISAYVVVFLVLWHIVSAHLARRNPDSDLVKAMAFVTGG